MFFIMDDEDVILSHSPLDEYLQNVTDLPFSKYTCASSDKPERQNDTSLKENYFTNVTTNLKKYVVDLLCNARSENNTKLYRSLLTSLMKLYESGFLQENDQALLRDIIGVIQHRNEHLGSSQIQENGFVVNKKMTVSAFILTLIAIIIQSQNVFLAVVSLLFAVVVLGFYCVSYFDRKRVESLRTCVEIFVECFEKFHHCTQLSIKHIREVEVMNHGLHGFRKTIPLTSVTINDTKKCSQLRQCLKDALVDFLLQLRTDSRFFVKNYAKQLFFYKEEFIVSVDLENLSAILPTTDDQKASLSLPTITLEDLKSTAYVYHLFLSEFVFSFIVCLYSVAANEKNDDRKVLIKQLCTVLQHLKRLYDKHYSVLDKNFQKSRNDIFHKEPTAVEERYVLKKQIPQKELFNSCKINIYSALNRMEEIQSLIPGDCQSETNKIDVITFEKLWLQFNINLDNARCCLEDVYDSLKLKDTVSSIGDNSKEVNKDEDDMVDEENPPLFIPPTDIDGDMLFEGESKAPTAVNSMGSESIEELQQLATKRKENKRLLRELKTIFAVKESPVGLLKFPLQKVNIDEHSLGDCVDLDEDRTPQQKTRDKTRGNQHNDIENYEATNTLEDENNVDEEVPLVRIGLPVGFLNQLSTSAFPSRNEETFGESDSEQGDDDS